MPHKIVLATLNINFDKLRMSQHFDYHEACLCLSYQMSFLFFFLKKPVGYKFM